MRSLFAVCVLALACVPAHGADAALVRLKSGSFDPLRDDRPAPAGLRSLSAGESAWILPHRGPISASWREAVGEAGGRIVGYLPDNAYLVRATPEVARGLADLDGTRWLGSYRPADRVDPLLLGRMGALSRQPDVGLEVLSFREEPTEELVDGIVALARTTGTALVSEQRSEAGRSRLGLSVPGRYLAQVVASLAVHPAVEWLALAPGRRPLNDAAAWICQSDVEPAMPLFAAELTGVGQVVGIADTGVDTSACQFRFDGSQLTRANNTPPPTANATNPSAKVISYYEIPGSEAYDHAVFLFHGTRVAGSAVGDDHTGAIAARSAPFTPGRDAADGLAPGAQLVVQDIGTSFGTLTGFLDQAALQQQAYDTEVVPGIGVRIHVDAYGFDPPAAYSGESAALDETLWRLRDYTAVFAAGNWGEVDPATCDPPPCDPWDGSSSLSGLGAVAKNSVTVGAVGNPGAAESRDDVMPESARGPTLEGLLKPDVMAPGHNLSALGDQDANNPNCGRDRLSQLGTSTAAGTVGGLAALVRQYFTDGYYPSGVRQRMDPACDDGTCDPEVFNPSNALVKAVLVNAARSMAGQLTGDTNTVACPGAGCSAPSYGQGWGRVVLDDALFFTGDERSLTLLTDTWNGATDPASVAGRGASPKPAIVALEAHNFAFSVGAGSAEPLEVTLVWSDPAASPAAVSSLVNDLDLQVSFNPGDCAAGSTLHYLGNDFHPDEPWSVSTSDPLSQGADHSNPVEQVAIESPQAGSYSVRVTGFNVPGNGAKEVPAEPEVDAPDLINSWEQGYALIVTGPVTTPLVPPCPFASGDPRVGCVDQGPGMEVDFISWCGAGTPECPDCVPESWRWDFGDGTVRPGAANDSHTYTVGGLYRATLTVCEAGLEGRIKFPIEIIAGTTAMPVAVGNSLLMRKNLPSSNVTIFWTDEPVPDVTGYNVYQFDTAAKLPTTPPNATKVNTTLRLHGALGETFIPEPDPPNGLWYYQVRGVNCDETLIGP